MTRLILAVLNAGSWVWNKVTGRCHPYCDYSKCTKTATPGTADWYSLACPKCGRVTKL